MACNYLMDVVKFSDDDSRGKVELTFPHLGSILYCPINLEIKLGSI